MPAPVAFMASSLVSNIRRGKTAAVVREGGVYFARASIAWPTSVSLEIRRVRVFMPTDYDVERIGEVDL